MILFFRLIWFQSIPKKKMIFFVRSQEALNQSGLEVRDPVLPVRTSSGLMGLRGTSMLGRDISLTIMVIMRPAWK